MKVPVLFCMALALAACGPSDRQPPAVADATAAGSADSLVLTLRDSTGVWFVAGRPDTSNAGVICTERLLELRSGGRRVPVPLLYTIGTPTPINDSTLRAALYRHCEVQAWYLVDTRTGLPKPERDS
ncbi:MAG: hypothetical protein ABI836_05660 [Gemmatimonadota bacterium]